ncbi:cation transporter [Nitrogeniibacter mangrovi]|uniref:Cation transporter n=2 Tax=Nitrogeniibacter mangrovi TaxID=2016596 RepID=A0A6C1BBC6_9RHOO|nr:cation transporter [Nitrogeniibacter mangrovi]
MDCPSEEQLVRMQLGRSNDVVGLAFDLPARTVTVYHNGDAHAIAGLLAPLGFGHTLLDSGPCTRAPAADHDERRVLWQLMAINLLMFVIEIIAGWLGESTGLLADGLDMFADAAVYALALLAVGGAAHRKLRTAHLSGWLQLVLGLGIVVEVGRRIWFGAEPQPPIMLGIALLALVANAMCVLLLMRHRDGGAHMKASWIFTANDALANVGVILAGALVGWLHAPWPDWLIGTAIGALILHGAWRILRLREG